VSGTLNTLQKQLLALLVEQLQTLLRQAQAQGIALPPGAAVYLTAGSTPATLSAVTENLTIGSADANVSALQSFLIAQAKGSAAATLGVAGVTGTFGALTQAALAEYQNAVRITPAQGYFGPRTKAYLENAGF
jgi:peptidoglycan hydrolase-like protein with peptidoglycan-binding domain